MAGILKWTEIWSYGIGVNKVIRSMVLQKLKYLGKALALFKVFKTYSLTNKDIADADNLAEHLSDRKAEFKLILAIDRKSTRLNSSHVKISYAVFCLKK